jgi:hypothetical protein
MDPDWRVGAAGRGTATAHAVVVSRERRGMLPICKVRPLPGGRDGVTIDQSWQQQLCQGCSARLIRAGAVGKKLEILMTIDDPDTFNQPWQALRQYDRVNRTLSEDICSENNFNPFDIDYGTPVAEKPDF